MEELLNMLKLMSNSDALNEFISDCKPVAGNIAQQALGIWADIVADDKHYNLTAAGAWKQYRAYVAAGFDEEQAMELLLNNNAEFVKRVKDAGRRTSTQSRSIKG